MEQPQPSRVLLVEDDKDIGETTCTLLSQDGHSVELALSAEVALALAMAGARYDIVLCDLRLPGMSGFELAERLRERMPGTPIWALSGWAHQLADGDPRRALFEGLIAKPVHVGELRALLARLGT